MKYSERVFEKTGLFTLTRKCYLSWHQTSFYWWNRPMSSSFRWAIFCDNQCCSKKSNVYKRRSGNNAHQFIPYQHNKGLPSEGFVEHQWLNWISTRSVTKKPFDQRQSIEHETTCLLSKIIWTVNFQLDAFKCTEWENQFTSESMRMARKICLLSSNAKI